MELKEQKFGIEIEMTGITREQAAQVMPSMGSDVVSTTFVGSCRAFMATSSSVLKFISDAACSFQQ